jgi:hypothetical protein
VAADDRRVELVTAYVVEHRRRRVHHPPVAPGAQRREDAAQFPACLGELVLVPRRVLAVQAPREHAACLKRAQPRGEPVAGGAGVPRDRVEPLVAEADLAHGQQRPLLADQVQCGRHRAGAAGQFLAHSSQPTLVA